MSKLSEYSKFDHLSDDDSNDDEEEAAQQHVESSPAAQPQQPVATTRKDAKTGRYVFEYGGKTIYEWEQSLEGVLDTCIAWLLLFLMNAYACWHSKDTPHTSLLTDTHIIDVNIYVTAPKGVKACQLFVNIETNRLQLGIKGSDSLFINEKTCGKVDTTESSWYMDDSNIINIVLQKAHRAETWASALVSSADTVNAVQTEEMKKTLLLERFQQENPGFDFRDADFNGSVPDPRTFMGGVKYKWVLLLMMIMVKMAVIEGRNVEPSVWTFERAKR